MLTVFEFQKMAGSIYNKNLSGDRSGRIWMAGAASPFPSWGGPEPKDRLCTKAKGKVIQVTMARKKLMTSEWTGKKEQRLKQQ